MHVIDDAAVFPGVDDVDGAGSQLGKILGPANILQGVIRLEIGPQGRRIGNLTTVDQLHHCLIDPGMRCQREVLSHQEFRNLLKRPVVDENRPQQATLSLNVPRQLPICWRFGVKLFVVRSMLQRPTGFICDHAGDNTRLN